MRPGGVLVVNTSLDQPPAPPDGHHGRGPVPANEIAKEAGSAKAANMVALGAFLGASRLVDLELVKAVARARPSPPGPRSSR